jgi:hypothetical protein
MKAHSQLVDPAKFDTGPITIAMLHHPPEWLSDSEQNSYGDRPNTFRHMAEQSHIILAGHVHGAVEPPDRKYNSAYLFKCGATYAGDQYRNNFSILRIDLEKRTLSRLSYEFDPRSGWYPIRDDSQYLLTRNPIVPEASLAVAYDYQLLVRNAKEFAIRFIEQKAYVLTHDKKIPELIKRKVAVHNKEERIGKKQRRELRLRTEDNIAKGDKAT